MAALAVVPLLLPLSQGDLLAQQTPGQAWPQYPNGQYPRNDPYNGQYASNQQLPFQPLTAEQLQQLVAPIALYPDALLAQILAAATYPVQVAGADHWLQAQGNASPDQIAAGADAQNWDPSVKGLTAFPQVLAQMDRSLQWTTDLGNAYFNQPQDVLETVQVLRQRAQNAGTLQNTPQQAISYNQGYIQLAPVNPQVVYVPSYNPWDVYGQPVQPYPGFSLLGAIQSFAGSAPLRFGLGIAMSAFNNTSFGWLGWALNWLTQSVLFHQENYSSQSTSVARWGSQRGGSQRMAFARQPEPYSRGQGNYGRPGAEYDGRFGTRGQDFLRQPARNQENYADNRSYGGNRPWESPGRTYPRPEGYGTRPGLLAYNHSQPPITMPVRPQSYARPGYASGFYGRSTQAYASPQQAWRGPAPQRGDFGQRYSSAPVGRGFAEYNAKPQHSGGFHLFGGGHGGEKSYGGGHAPKFSSGGKHSGGGGGSHSGGHHGGGHHH
ncbi:MAG: DUF3300 domain-containing protein [Terracidiphilus sp.]|nr:DUF3300 domain-containing protein [Terracidiphilus sp.]MDR3775413.1 DUF3300 domain-containing protein [Terracidiphilus sp.]